MNNTELLKKASAGDAVSSHYLGLMYIEGKGVEQNINFGCAWLYISKIPEAIEHAESILTPEQKPQALFLMDKILEKLS